jgi:hypothetical protein
VPNALAGFAAIPLMGESGNRCYADGILSSCGYVYTALNNGFGLEVPPGTTRVGQNEYWTNDPSIIIIIDWDNGYYGFAPKGAKKSPHTQGWSAGNAEGWLDLPIERSLPFLWQSDNRTNEEKRSAALAIAQFALYARPECNDLISGHSGVASALITTLYDSGQFSEQDDEFFHTSRTQSTPAFTRGQGTSAEVKLRIAVNDPNFQSTGFFERERYGIPGIPGGLSADIQRAFIFIHELAHATGRFTHPGQGDPKDFDEPPIKNEDLNKLIWETCFQ